MFLKTLLLDPHEFFRDNPWADDFAAAAGVAVLSAIVTVINFLLIGVIIAQKVDATVTQNGQQVPLDSILWDIIVGNIILAFLAPLVGWVLLTGLLHIIIKLADGEGTFSDSLTVTGWGLVPTIFTAFLATGSIYLSLRGLPVIRSPDQLANLVQQIEGGAGIFGILIPLVAAGWQGYIWAFGIKHFHDLRTDTAVPIAGIVAFLLFLVSAI